jgi:hypothetical protein
MEPRVPRPLVRELRAKLRDYPEVNYLYQAEESADHELARCIYEALEELNLMPPVFDQGWTFTAIPAKMIRVLLDLAVIRVLHEVMIWMARNEFRYTTGNTSIQLFDRWRSFQALVPMLSQKAESLVTSAKVAMNCDAGWGSNMTEMYDAWRSLDTADWVTVSA